MRGVDAAGTTFTDLSESDALKRLANLMGDSLVTLDLIDDGVRVKENEASLSFLMNELKTSLQQISSSKNHSKVMTEINQIMISGKTNTQVVRRLLNELLVQDIKNHVTSSYDELLLKIGFWYYTLSVSHSDQKRDMKSTLIAGRSVVALYRDSVLRFAKLYQQANQMKSSVKHPQAKPFVSLAHLVGPLYLPNTSKDHYTFRDPFIEIPMGKAKLKVLVFAQNKYPIIYNFLHQGDVTGLDRFNEVIQRDIEGTTKLFSIEF